MVRSSLFFCGRRLILKCVMRVEICDFGYPQNSEIDTLKSYITTESIVSTAIAAVCGIIRHVCWLSAYRVRSCYRRNHRRLQHRLLELRVGEEGMSSIRRMRHSWMS